MTALLCSLLIFYYTLLTSGNQISGKVATVSDGNTLEVSTPENGQYRVVLFGIDCPETGQEYGREAASFMEKTVLGNEVVVKLHGKDRAGNYIGVVLLTDGTDVRIALLDKGLAWTAEKDPIAGLEAHRLEAMREKRGLWSGDAPVPPWVYRRQQSMLEPKSR